MKLTFVGVGNSSTSSDYYQSSFVLEHNGKHMLVDCGTDARFSLGEIGITSANVGVSFDAVYITHIHADHCGGMEWLAFCTYFNQNKTKKSLLMAHPDVLRDLESIMSPGLNSLKGIDASLSTFFDVYSPLDRINWEGLEIDMVKGQHVWSNHEHMPMYGLYFSEAGRDDRAVFYSGDTILTRESFDIMENAHLIFHDCETGPRVSGVHAHYNELAALPAHIKEKMWLYHYWPNPIQDPVADGFCGWVRKGQVFEV